MRDLVKRRRDSEQEFDMAIKKLKRDHAHKDTLLEKQIHKVQDRVMEFCLQETCLSRQEYLVELENTGHIIFRETPPWKKGPSIEPSPPPPHASLLLHCLEQYRNENFAPLFFETLGAMELFNVYRTCRAMRRTLHGCLSQCIMNVINRDCALLQATQKIKWINNMEFALIDYGDLCRAGGGGGGDGDTDVNDRHGAIPKLLFLTHMIHKHLRIYGHIYMKDISLYEDVDLCALFVVSDDRPSPCVTPLLQYNLFACKYTASFDTARAASQRRYRQLYGPQFVESDEYDDMALFDHTDCLTLDLEPVTVDGLRAKREARQVNPGHGRRPGNTRVSRDTSVRLNNILIVDRELVALYLLRTAVIDAHYPSNVRRLSVMKLSLPGMDTAYQFDHYEVRLRVIDALDYPRTIRENGTAFRLDRVDEGDITLARSMFDQLIARAISDTQQQRQQQQQQSSRLGQIMKRKIEHSVKSVQLPGISSINNNNIIWIQDEETIERNNPMIPSSPVYRSPLSTPDTQWLDMHAHAPQKDKEEENGDWPHFRLSDYDADDDDEGIM